MSITKQFLKDTYKVKLIVGHNYQEVRKRVYCNDGFNVSIQASTTCRCTPKESLEDGNYSEVELGFPSEVDDLITPYAEDTDDLTGTVYNYVPIEIVDKLIKKHGGIQSDADRVNKLEAENKKLKKLKKEVDSFTDYVDELQQNGYSIGFSKNK